MVLRLKYFQRLQYVMDSFEIHNNRVFERDMLEIDLQSSLTKFRVHITFSKSFLLTSFKQTLGETLFNSPYYYYRITSKVCGEELGNSTTVKKKRLSTRKNKDQCRNEEKCCGFFWKGIVKFHLLEVKEKFSRDGNLFRKVLLWFLRLPCFQKSRRQTLPESLCLLN